MVRLSESMEAARELAEVLGENLPTGERMTPDDKDFWLLISRMLTSDQLHQLAKAVAFMRKVEGF